MGTNVSAGTARRLTIREETEADFFGIAEITRAAFGGDYEVELIEKLRAAGLMILSLVAVDGGSTVGHILFSELPVESVGPRPVGIERR